MIPDWPAPFWFGILITILILAVMTVILIVHDPATCRVCQQQHGHDHRL